MQLRCEACGKIVEVNRYEGGQPYYWCGVHRAKYLKEQEERNEKSISV